VITGAFDDLTIPGSLQGLTVREGGRHFGFVAPCILWAAGNGAAHIFGLVIEVKRKEQDE